MSEDTVDSLGIIRTEIGSEAFLVKDSIIVTMLYNTTFIKKVFNTFIEEMEAIQTKLPGDDCLTEILTNAKNKRFYLKQFLDELSGNNRNERQLLLGAIGVTGLLSFGLTALEIAKKP